MFGSSHRRARQRGQSLVELALITPVLLIILMGLVQFALIFERQIGIDNAIREAARRAATLETKTDAAAQANATWTLGQVQSLLMNVQSYEASKDLIEVCIVTPASNPTDASGTAQVVVRIKDAYSHPLFLPIVSLILDPIDGVTDNALLASSSTEFHVEQSSPAPNVINGGVARSNGVNTLCTP